MCRRMICPWSSAVICTSFTGVATNRGKGVRLGPTWGVMSLALAALVLLMAGCTRADDAAPSATETVTTTVMVTVEASPVPDVAAPSPAPTPSPRFRTSALDLPLIEAAAAGEVGEVESLLRRGASVRATDAQGRTPLVAAAYGNHVEVARVLLAAGGDPDEKDATVQSAYLIATSEVGDDPALLDLLLDGGATADSRDSFNGTGLIRAAERGYPRIVERLLETDIEVDHVNRLGWTAVHEAIVLGDGGPAHVEVVGLLVDAGADVNLPGNGQLPLARATARGYDEIAAILRDAGASP